ncbi:MAG: 4a-hydroxytetrahydrobiopterin dehydratase [Gaiellales bacterium]
MADRTPLTYSDVARALCARPGWALVDGRLVREHDCGSWGAARTVLDAIVAAADDLDHHPDLEQRVGRVRIGVRTHRPAGISALDLALVDRVDAVLGAGETA